MLHALLCRVNDVLALLQQLLQQGAEKESCVLAVQALAYLSSSKQHQEQLLESHCLQHLLPLLLRGPGCAAAKWAVHAVCNLTAHSKACAGVAKAGTTVLQAFGKLMESTDSPCAVPAALAVANLAAHGCFSDEEAVQASAKAVAGLLMSNGCPEPVLAAALACAGQLKGNKAAR
jgi:hypothetical protein